jgi:hypothetical protein
VPRIGVQGFVQILRLLADRVLAAAKASGLPASARIAFSPSCRISRTAGRSEATMGRPDAMYSNSFRGEV